MRMEERETCTRVQEKNMTCRGLLQHETALRQGKQSCLHVQDPRLARAVRLREGWVAGRGLQRVNAAADHAEAEYGAYTYT